MKMSRFALAVFFIAKTAFAANMAAPLDMKMSRVQENAWLQGLPTANLVIPKNAPIPQNYEMSFRNGLLIPDGAALDGNFRSGNDPRAAAGYASCTAVMERPTMPKVTDSVQLDEAPASSSSSTSFESGRTVTVQQVVFKFTAFDEYRTATHNTIYCYRVSDKPMTTLDIRAGLGPKFLMLLSAEQTQSIQSMAQLHGVLNAADRNLTGPSYKTEEDRSAAKPASASPKDGVVGTERSGGFVSRPSQTPAQ